SISAPPPARSYLGDLTLAPQLNRRKSGIFVLPSKPNVRPGVRGARENRRMPCVVQSFSVLPTNSPMTPAQPECSIRISRHAEEVSDVVKTSSSITIEAPFDTFGPKYLIDFKWSAYFGLS